MLSHSKKAKIDAFDPNGIGNTTGNLYGLPFDYDESAVIIIPVPWEVTVSYSDGTAQAPQAILDASPQLDLFDFDVPNAWQYGIYMLPISQKCVKTNGDLREQARKYIDFLEKGGNVSQQVVMKQHLNHINQECHALKEFVKRQSLTAMSDGKLVGVLGGDHSSPLGLIEAIAEHHGEFGILQIDAHADLRDAYEGFTYSHASIMFNALKLSQVTRLVSVGIRDICEAEVMLAKVSNGRIVPFYDDEIQRKVHIERQLSWAVYCQEIVAQLPAKVYISFDIDGLDPKMCPHTGTPVAGGLSMAEAMYLLKTVVDSGRQIVGFDLCEVSPAEDNEWDANVGARVLYKLAIYMAASQQQTA
ncbi:MAG: agmatinase family protein [Chitinophagales bacterium]|jgi:agmatinase|nr:agmatinase family protein [Chitinophagales bacterium]